MTSTDTHTDSLLDKVRKLLAKAEATDFPGEAETLSAKAAELIAKYGIDQALLDNENLTRDEVGTLDIALDKPYALDKAHLANALALALRCKAIRHSNGGVLKVFGFAADLERLEILYTSLLVQATRGVLAAPTPAYANTTSFRKSWLTGFTVRVARRVREAEAAAAQQVQTPAGVSTALVLRSRSTLVDQAFADAYPHTRHGRRTLGRSGYEAGQAAGSRADIGQHRVGGQRAAIR